MDQTKKISFGFTKQIKKPNIILNTSAENKTSENKVELIDCLESNSIKLLNEDENKKSPLIIPVQQNRTTTAAALASLRLRQAVLNDTEENKISQDQDLANRNEHKNDSSDKAIDTNESLEKKAARELLEEIHNNKNQSSQSNITVTVPLKPDELPLDGAEEPSADDYENIPISQFGLAMLRGMGWKDEQQKKDKSIDSDQPILRPKGMGLGADKVIKQKPSLVPPEKNEKLEIKKNAYVRILGGKHKDLYGQIEGLDDHAGRVIVKLALGGNRESLNEFLVQPISKGEYTKFGKVINSAKYEEYKRIQEAEQQRRTEHDVKYENNDLKIEDRKKMTEEMDIKYIKKEIKIEKSEKHKFENRNTTSTSNSKCHDSIERNKYDDRELSSNKIKKELKKDTSRHRRRSSSKSSIEERNYRLKKKSHKSKKHKNQKQSDSSEDDKRHKKKTKKSKKSRSRSRCRR